ncbi:Tat pathway signal sequence domain protein [Streptomyces ureilyticus]|uniref:Tat pathway signal sequence domain protein n=1 Tax=Streptomyces ureilyticus TaxID=1775131 RepID=A0ABX0DUS7_9ACTN|nr:Tat pathway signal sequence domain protein [Streptomyces ureilyticus]NGO45688.1 Tat pathway signal sequence domain protein [Streptomyces ureilyticus]
MSGVGPVEPGEGTRAWDIPDPDTPPSPPPEPPRGRLAQTYTLHRRVVLPIAAAVALLAGGGYLYATRPEEAPPEPPPYPSQVVGMTYLGREPPPDNAPARSFSMGVRLTVQSGPQVTVLGITQPYAGLSLASVPRLPFRTRTSFPHKINITMQVTECAQVPTNAGLPFLDVTMRNTRAIQVHSFILGEHYAQDLSEAVQAICGTNSATSPKP